MWEGGSGVLAWERHRNVGPLTSSSEKNLYGQRFPFEKGPGLLLQAAHSGERGFRGEIKFFIGWSRLNGKRGLMGAGGNGNWRAVPTGNARGGTLPGGDRG